MRIRGTLIAATAIALLTAACGGSDTTTPAEASDADSITTTVTAAPRTTTTQTAAPTDTATSTTQAPSTTTSTTEPQCAPSPLEDVADDSTRDGRVLPPGCYSTQRWGRELVIEITDSEVGLLEFPYTFGFTRLGEDENEGNMVLLAEFTGVIPAEQIGAHPPHDEPIGNHMVDVPSDLATWIESAPQLVVTDAGENTVAGDLATWWDIEIDASAGATFTCSYGDCVAALVPSPPEAQGTNFVMGNAARFRIVQLSGAGEGLFLWIQAAPDDFDSTVALADQIIDTLGIDA